MNNETLTDIFNKCYERFELKRLIKEELFKAINEERWITIHPHGEDSEDYRRLKLEDGETPKEAIDRVYKKEDKKEKSEADLKEEKKQLYQDILKAKKEGNKELHHKLLQRYNEVDKQLKGQKISKKDNNTDTKEDKNNVPKRIDYKIYKQKENELYDKLSKINIDDYKGRIDEYNAEIRKIREERNENLDKLKEAYKKEIERIKNIDINKLSYQEIENFEKDLRDIYNDIMDISDSKFIMSKLQQLADIKRSLEAKEKAKKVGGYTEKLQNLANFSYFSDISSYPIELQKHIYNNYKKVYDKFPQLAKQGYGKLSKENIKSSTYANNLSIVNSVTLNSSWYDDLPKLEKSYAEDVMSEWHPQGTDYNSIITHELGHGLLGYIQSNLGISGKAIRSKVLKKLGLHIKDINAHLSRYPNNSRDPVHEFFAEAFAEYMDSPNPRPLAVEFGKEIERIFRDLDRA